MEITQASHNDSEVVAELFDAYRQFYRQAADIEGARNFIDERLNKEDSTIFIAEIDGNPAGFVQLYPSFTSVGMARIYVLNDLFVAENARGRGVATALMKQAASFAKSTGAKQLDLTTDISNEAAQALYEKLGWQKQTSFFTYSLVTDSE